MSHNFYRLFNKASKAGRLVAASTAVCASQYVAQSGRNDIDIDAIVDERVSTVVTLSALMIPAAFSADELSAPQDDAGQSGEAVESHFYLRMFGEIARGLLTAIADILVAWPLYAIGRFREAYSPEKPLSKDIPLLMRDIAAGDPIIRSIRDALKKSVINTLRSLYGGAKEFYVMAYSWMIVVEFVTNELAKHYGLSAPERALACGVTGAIVAAPGETQMVLGRSFAQILRQGVLKSIAETRGTLLMIPREIFFASAAVIGLSTKVAALYANHTGCDPSDVRAWLAGEFASLPFIFFSQIPARYAALKQSSYAALKQGRSNKKVDSYCEIHQSILRLAATVAENSPFRWRALRFLHGLFVALMPGVLPRSGSIVQTKLVYAASDWLCDFSEPDPEMTNSMK